MVFRKTEYILTKIFQNIIIKQTLQNMRYEREQNMPPKPKFTKEEVIDAAYELMEEKGIAAVVARDIGKKLNTTTTPIFTYFSGMDELKEAVYQKALAESTEYIKECLNYSPAFKEFGLRWIRFSKEHPNIYRLVYMLEGVSRPTVGFVNQDFLEVLSPMVDEVMGNFGLARENAETLVKEMSLHAQGIASFCVRNAEVFQEQEISESLGRVCLSLVMGFKIQDGSYNEEMARFMLAHTGDMPKRRK